MNCRIIAMFWNYDCLKNFSIFILPFSLKTSHQEKPVDKSGILKLYGVIPLNEESFFRCKAEPFWTDNCYQNRFIFIISYRKLIETIIVVGSASSQTNPVPPGKHILGSVTNFLTGNTHSDPVKKLP